MNKVLRGLGTALLVVAFFAGSTWGAPPAKVLILPPALHGGADMAFLQQGVVDMLTTRLAAPGKVTVLTPPDGTPGAAKNQADALAIGRQQGADYVVFGSLTLLGGGISTDLRMVVPADERLALSFSRSGKDQAALITHMDQFAAQVNETVFGRPPAPAAQTATLQPKISQPAPDSIYQHPEKLLAEPMAVEQGATSVGDAPTGAGFVTPGGEAVRGPRINDQVQGVALGDLTGDGRLESVYLGLHSVWVYRHINGRFAKMAHIKGVGNYVGVDTADLNGNGRHEIFVTSTDNSDGQLISFVLEYNGRTFEPRAKLLDYYFRAVNQPQRGRILLGQRQGIDEFYAPGIFEMAFQDGKYKKAAHWDGPRRLNLFGMGRGTFAPGDSDQFVAFSKSRYLQLFNYKGKPLWKSAMHFGGSVALIQKTNDELAKETMLYLPARIEVLDLDSDGVDEVVVMCNQESTGTALDRTRILKSGRLEVLKAGTLGLSPYWRSPTFSKFISDFALADLDGDGRLEIVAAVVLKTGSALSSGQSQIYIFSLGKAEGGAKQQ